MCILLTKLLIVALTMATGAFVVREVFEEAQYLNNYAWPLAVIGFMAYLSANLCLGMFQTVV